MKKKQILFIILIELLLISSCTPLIEGKCYKKIKTKITDIKWRLYLENLNEKYTSFTLEVD
ncbi:MAG: hypothetical protein ACFFDW_10985, partial [Candidatus Thorarchaeota archaeon]